MSVAPPDTDDLHAHYRACLADILRFPPKDIEALCPASEAQEHRQYLLLPFDLDGSGRIANQVLKDLSAAAYAMYRMAVAADAVIDDGRTGALRFAVANAELAALLISRHIPLDAAYWRIHRFAYDRMWAAAEIERDAITATLSDLDSIRIGKSGLLELPVHWHAALTRSEPALDLANAILEVGRTFQCMDDISDFRADLQVHRLTYYGRLAHDFCADHRVDLTRETPEMQLRLLILCPGFQADVLRAIDATRAAAAVIELHGLVLWHHVAQKGLDQMIRYARAIEVARAPLERVAS